MRHNYYIAKKVNSIPKDLKEGILYISERYELGAHKCMCGCGEIIYTPFRENGWTYVIEDETYSLEPSIHKLHQKCKKRYFLKNGAVKWYCNQ